MLLRRELSKAFKCSCRQQANGLGRPAMGFFRELAQIVGGDTAIGKRRFIELALQELSVVLFRCNGSLLGPGRTVVAKARGRAFRLETLRPNADVGG